MGKSKLRGKDLRKINYTDNEMISLAMEVMAKHFRYESKASKLQLLENVLLHPKQYLDHPNLSRIAQLMVETPKVPTPKQRDLRETPLEYSIYGKSLIESGAIRQMNIAMQLPVAVGGALMPDAHVGYGLPIGGVLATKNEIIPYAVGMDIGCRMCLTVYPENSEFLTRFRYQAKTALKDETHFGITKTSPFLSEHEVLDRKEFNEIKLLKGLAMKAYQQLGTSGSGNHFVELGEVELPGNNRWSVPAGKYVGILSHSGSRSLGANIAGHYTKIAKEQCKLPSGAQGLAWLDLNSEEGMEYWIAMNLAGDYAQACHDTIHDRIAKSLGIKPIIKVENHHNFAWKEKQHNGEEWIVHRKGSTPASYGQLGIIPATMTDPGYIVSGKGNANSLNSASHGAGRKLSRGKARSSITGSDMKKMLKNTGITLIGAGVDEAPIAYKNLEEVMEHQQELIKIEGKFTPKIVRMDK